MFANSLGTTLEMWDAQAEALRDRYRVLRFDHRGHRTVRELAKDALALLDRLEIDARRVLRPVARRRGRDDARARARPSGSSAWRCAATALEFGPPEQWHERAATVRVRGHGGDRAGRPASAGSRRPPTTELVARFDAMLRAQPRRGLRRLLRGARATTTCARRRVQHADAHDRRRRRPRHAAGQARGDPGRPPRRHRRRTPHGQRRAGRGVQRDPDPVPRRGSRDARPPRGPRRRARRPREVRRPDCGRTSSPATPGARSGPARAWTAAPAARSPSPRSSRSATRTSWRCTSAPRCATASHRDEIKEILLHAAIYCGVPAANTAFAIATKVFEED